MFLFVRLLPMISIFELNTLLPEAEVEHELTPVEWSTDDASRDKACVNFRNDG